MTCRCRNCRKEYDESKSRAEYKGYCSMKCQHEKAKSLAGAPTVFARGEYSILKQHNEVGSVPASTRSKPA
jgi:hypothetical protein